MEKSKTNILIISPCLLFAEGLKELFIQRMNVTIFSAPSSQEAREILTRKPIQLALVDIPNGECQPAVRLIKSSGKQVKILVFNDYTDWNKIKAIMSAGAAGYLLKSCCKNELFEAVRDIMNGESYVSKQLGNMFYESLTNNKPSFKNFGYQLALSKRECEVLQLAGKDYSSKEIASSLFISYSTVETHRKKIISKLGVKSITGALDVAYKQGMLEL